MRRTALAAALLIPAALMTPAANAQTTDPEGGASRMREGLRMLLEGFGTEMAPALDRLRSLTDQLDAYEAPEMLPNGDIIIRRKTPRVPDGSRPGDTPPDGPLEELDL